MKRIGVALAGFAFGLLLTWLCLAADRFITWHPLRGVAWLHVNPHGPACAEIGPCDPPLSVYLLLSAILLGPATMFAVANGYGWRRWTAARWWRWQAGLVALTVALYLAAELT